MKYRKLGRYSIKVSEISIGGWLTYGKSVDQAQTAAIIRRAVDLGINFIDIADIYARGEAERVIGAAIKDMTRSDLVISSKVFWPMSENVNDRGLSRKHIIESIDKSLARIGTDYLDLYFCHRFDPETEIEEVVRAMDHVVRQGKVLYWGTSVWDASHIRVAVAEAEKINGYIPAVEQPRYNMIDRHIETEILPICQKHGLGLVVWSPLAQGLLTGKYNKALPKGTRGAETDWLKSDLTEGNLEKVKALTTLAESHDITISQLALAWVLRLPAISSAITGATRVEQVEENVAACDVILEQETLDQIESILGNNPAEN
ncbi:MAG: aldo/keto reductase family protein [candidate division Zixibacteria bacterium]|jgi:voltage-dependent potassium channel beta subunit|nr:aldo/keto reductase family protein [candidate division Zixibacteria bacterium]